MGKYKPVPEKDMRIKSSRETICETLRECFIQCEKIDKLHASGELKDLPDRMLFIKYRLRLATAMAKRMSKALKDSLTDGEFADLFESKKGVDK